MTLTTPEIYPPVEARKGPRWINRRVSTLDAKQDYVEIVRLKTLFHVSEFFVDWAFTHIMCRATTGHSSKAITREGTGKLVNKADNRFDDTSHHFLVWNEWGPGSPQTTRSVDIINALHSKYQKIYPSAFDDQPLWVYVIAWEVAGIAILAREVLGLPELDDKEKEARSIWGHKLAESFTYTDGTPLSDHMPPLETFEDWIDFVHEYESQPWAPDANSTACANAVLDKFAERHKRLPRSLARALVTTFWHDGQFECNGIERPTWFWREAAKNYMRIHMVAMQLKPSPKESMVEKMLRETAESGGTLSPIMRAAVGAGVETNHATSSGCPMGFGMVNPDEVPES